MVIFNFFQGYNCRPFSGLQLNQHSPYQSYTSEDIHIMRIKTVAIAKMRTLQVMLFWLNANIDL